MAAASNTHPCGITGVHYDKKFLEDVEGSAPKLAGMLGLADSSMVWNLYFKDAGTRPVLQDWIARRSDSFGCKDLPSGKKVVRANIIQWACENRGRTVMLAKDPPQVGTDGVTEDTLMGLSCLWYIKRLMLAKPSLFPRSRLNGPETVLDRVDLVKGWKVLAFFWKQVNGGKVPAKAQSNPAVRPVYHNPTTEVHFAGAPAAAAKAAPTIVSFDPADLAPDELLNIWNVVDEAADPSTEDLIACDLALGQSYAESLRVTGHQRLGRAPLDHSDRDRLYDYMMTLDGFRRRCVVSTGPAPDPAAEETQESRRLARLAAAGEAMEAALLGDDAAEPTTPEPSSAEPPSAPSAPQGLGSSLSASARPVYAAAAALNLDPATRVLSPQCPNLVLEPWQVSGVDWMLEQEDSPVKGGILADDCGLGKTITALALILCAANRAAHRAVQNPPQPAFQPTLILCPAILLPTWLDELDAHFHGALHVLLFHGSSKHSGSVQKKAITVDTLDELQRRLAELDPNDPATARTVVLSTYGTWSLRTTTVLAAPAEPTNPDVSDLASFQAQEDEAVFDRGQHPGSGRKRPSLKPPTYDTVMAGRFARVLCDEGHHVKTISTRFHQSVSLLRARHHWIITATPLMNHARDLAGYLAILHVAADFPAPSDDAPRDAIEEYQDEAAATNYGLLHPRRFLALAQGGQLSARGGFYALPVIMRLIALARKMGSWVDRASPVLGRIGDDIPPMHVTTVDLQYPRRLQGVHDTRFVELVASMKKMRASDGDEEQGYLDWGVVRQLCLLSFSVKLEQFVHSVGRARATVAAIPDFASRPDRGLAFFWSHTTLERADTGPLNRFAAAKYLMTDSPKARYLMTLFREEGVFDALAGLQPRVPRFLIFCEQPLTLWFLEMLMDAWSVPAVTIKSTANDARREEAARAFDSSESNVAVLLVTFQVGAYGLNLHHACSRVVVAETPRNLNTLWQAAGRVHRLGQREPQRVWILSQQKSVERYLDWNNARKAIPQVAGECQEEWLPQIRQAVTEKVAALQATHAAEDPLDEGQVGAIARETERELLETMAAETLQKMLGQETSRLHFGGELEDSVKEPAAAAPFTPMKPRKRRQRRQRERPGKTDQVRVTIRDFDRSRDGLFGLRSKSTGATPLLTEDRTAPPVRPKARVRPMDRPPNAQRRRPERRRGGRTRPRATSRLR